MFFLYTVLILIFLAILLLFSRIQIEVKNLNFYKSNNETVVSPDYIILIKLFILKKVKILNRKITREKFENKKGFKKLQNILNIKNKNKNENSQILELKSIKNTGIKLKNTNLNIDIGTENAALTAILIGISYGVIINLLNYFFYLNNNVKLDINPVYRNKNELSLSFDGIFEFEFIHIVLLFLIF